MRRPTAWPFTWRMDAPLACRRRAGRGRLTLLRAAWLLLAVCAWPRAWSNDEPVLQAGSRMLALPAGATAYQPVGTRWQGMALKVQAFHAPVAVDVLARRLAGSMAAAPALLVEPGRAMLAWYEAPVHWVVQLTGQGSVTHGRLSGLTLSTPASDPSAVREPGVPASATLVHHGSDAEDAHGYRQVQVYAAQEGLSRDTMVAGLRRAGWRMSAVRGVQGARLRRGGAVLHVHCLPGGAGGACVLVREAAP